MPTVARHMTSELLTIAPDATLVEAARRMEKRGVGAVLVLERDRLVGILTERDILKAVASEVAATATVAERMTAHPETIEPGETTDQAGALMLHGGFRHLPVVDGGKVVGILSIRDLMRVALDDRMPRGV